MILVKPLALFQNLIFLEKQKHVKGVFMSKLCVFNHKNLAVIKKKKDKEIQQKNDSVVEIQNLLSRFMRHGKKLRIQNIFYRALFILKNLLDCENVFSLLSVSIRLFKPLAGILNQSTVHKIHRQFRIILKDNRSLYHSTKFIYQAVKKEQKDSKSDFFTALIVELYRLIVTPEQSGTFKEYIVFIENVNKLKYFRLKGASRKKR